MTIEEVIYCMTSYLPGNEIEHCLSCPYYGTKKVGFMKLCRSSEAHQMAADILRIYARHMNESTADADIVYRRDVLNTINANAITPIAIDMRLDELIDEINKIPPVSMLASAEMVLPENDAAVPGEK